MSNIVRSTLFAFAGIAMMACSDSRTTLTAAPDSPSANLGARGLSSVGFNGAASGFTTGKVWLTGGGAYAPSKASNTPSDDRVPNLGGGFSCLLGVEQGPLQHCERGQGVRWDTAQLLESASFKCTGKATEPLKSASTSDETVVLQADFYRAGDANDESFTAMMIVSDFDLDPDIDGVQNLWVQGVGCGTAIVHFNSGSSPVIE